MASKAPTASASRLRRPSGSLAGQVFDHLLLEILDMELRPFDDLSEARLAADLGVGRIPVRDAIARLAGLGLAEADPQRGLLVAPLSENRAMRSRFIREALEAPLARLAADRMTSEILARLDREIALQHTYASFADSISFLASDDNFHGLIAKAAGHEAIWDDVREAVFHLDRVRRLSLLNTGRMAAIIEEHAAIVASLQRKDPDAAEAGIRRHLSSLSRDIAAIRAAHPAYFASKDPDPKTTKAGH